MIRHVISAACGLGMLCTAPLKAEPVVVVEMFTSQGCVSCPPADAFFSTLVSDPRVIPLSLHVDYWDYIGWSDVFGSPAFTERQKNYARAIGSRTIYTPQFVVGGRDRVEGFDPDETHAALSRHFDQQQKVDLEVRRDGEYLLIEADAGQALPEPVRVQLVRYLPEETVRIERGENAGKTITYHNVVTSWDVIGDWSGQEPLALVAPAPGTAPAVVILQNMGPSEILAAARADGSSGRAVPLYEPENIGIGFLSHEGPGNTAARNGGAFAAPEVGTSSLDGGAPAAVGATAPSAPEIAE